MFFNEKINILKRLIYNYIMFIRNYKGEIIFFDTNKFKDEKSMYKELWFQMYNKKIEESSSNIKSNIIDYIKDKKNRYNL